MATQSAAPKVENQDTSAVGNTFQLRSLRPPSGNKPRAPSIQNVVTRSFDGFTPQLSAEQQASFKQRNDNAILKSMFGPQLFGVCSKQQQRQGPMNIPEGHDAEIQTPSFLPFVIPKQTFCEVCKLSIMQYINKYMTQHIQHQTHLAKCNKSPGREEIDRLIRSLDEGYDEVRRNKGREYEDFKLRSQPSKKAPTEDTFPSSSRVPILPERRQRTFFFLQKSTQL